MKNRQVRICLSGFLCGSLATHAAVLVMTLPDMQAIAAVARAFMALILVILTVEDASCS